MDEKLVDQTNNKEESPELEFIYHEGSSDIKLDIKENFAIDGDIFTKMTAKFRMGQRYGNETFFATYWKPGSDLSLKPDNIDALVFISHGYAEYLGDDYDDIARQMVSKIGKGCLVFGHDHLGHGRTTAPSPKERALATDMDDFTDPIVAHIQAVQQMVQTGEEQLPVFLLAHSMGGLIGISTILSHPQIFKGFIGIGPLMKMHPDNDNAAIRFFAKAIQGCCPRFSFPRFLTGVDVKKITRRKMVVDKARADKLRYQGGIKAGTAWFVFQNCDLVQSRFPEIEIPMLILQGGSDRLVDPAASQMLVENASSADKQMKNYPEAFHQLLAELDEVKNDVEKRTVNWINERLG